MRVLDGAVALLDANQGVEPQTETVWRQADKYGVPRMIFVNKMDKIGADFFLSVQMVKDRLGAKPIVLQLPLGVESSFKGIIDLVRMKAVVWDDEALGAKFHDEEIPADLRRSGQGISREARGAGRRGRRGRDGGLSRGQGAERGRRSRR